MKVTERRYDIDWIRVIAIGLLLVYHIGIVFQPWGVFIGFIQSDRPLEPLWGPMSLLNIWRIPLLFFVSGMGTYFSMRNRNLKQLLLERSRRILIPFLFGMIAVVPAHILIWENYYSQDPGYHPGPGHLWFLGNIFIYVLLLSPLFSILKGHEEKRLNRFLRKLLSHPASLLLMAGCFSMEAILLKPENYATFAMSWHGFFNGALAFLFGFLCAWNGITFWRYLLNWRWPLLLAATGLFLLRLLVFRLASPGYLIAFESVIWIFAVFGFGFKYLNRPGKRLAYLSEAAYPVYILHMVFLFLGSWLILPLEIPAWIQFVLIILFTFAGCFALYEWIIRRIGLLRILFGLKTAGTIQKVSVQPEMDYATGMNQLKRS